MDYKVLLVGADAVGKTTYLKRIITGEFQNEWKATNGHETHGINFYARFDATNLRSNIRFVVTEISYNNYSLRYLDHMDQEFDCIMVMYDITSKWSMYTAIGLVAELTEYFTDKYQKSVSIPVVLVANKLDLISSKNLKEKEYTPTCRMANLYKISAKSLFNYDKPFLYLARKLTNNPDLEFVMENSMDE